MPDMNMERLSDGLPSKSAKIRKLYQSGYQQAKIARFLGIRDQFVSNVVRAMKAKQDTRETEKADRTSFRVKMGPAGRIIIPAALRERYDLNEGDTLVVRPGEDGVVVEPLLAAVKRAQAMVREFVPEGVSLVDELIEERRKEAEKE